MEKHDRDVIVDHRVTLKCSTTSSNPASNITWFENDNLQENNHAPMWKSGEFHGTITSLKYTSTRTHRHEQRYITCCVSEEKEKCRTWTAHVVCKYRAGTIALFQKIIMKKIQTKTNKCVQNENKTAQLYRFW